MVVGVVVVPYGIDNALLCRSSGNRRHEASLLSNHQQAKEAKFNDRPDATSENQFIIIIEAFFTAPVCICTVRQSPALQISPSIQV